MGPTWGPSGADRTQVGPMLAPWTFLSGKVSKAKFWYLILYNQRQNLVDILYTDTDYRIIRNHFKIKNIHKIFSWLVARLLYFQSINTENIMAFHWAIYKIPFNQAMLDMLIQSSVIISQSNLSWFYTMHCDDRIKTWNSQSTPHTSP